MATFRLLIQNKFLKTSLKTIMTQDYLHVNHFYRMTKKEPANGFTVAQAAQMKMIADILKALLVLIR